MGGGILSLDTPMVTPGDDSFPQGSYMDQRTIKGKNDHEDDDEEEEEEDHEMMDHSSMEGVFTFDKETLNVENTANISHDTEVSKQVY
jgi:hypothetical protein